MSSEPNLAEKIYWSRIKNAQVVKRIAFFVHCHAILEHFEPIIEIDPSAFDVIAQVDDCEKTMVKERCQYLGVSLVESEYLIQNNIIYAKVVSSNAAATKALSHDSDINYTGKVFVFPLIKLLGLMNIRIMYAAGKIKWNLSLWNEYYDEILVFGDFHERLFRNKFKNSSIKQIGYPRFDSYFKNLNNKQELISLYNCNANKKTIAWLPTWKGLSSVPSFVDIMPSLLSDFNVIAKPHPLMKNDDNYNYQKLLKSGLTTIVEDQSNIGMYQIADLMLFDNGGPMFGAIYTGKKFGILDLNLSKDQILELKGYNSTEDIIKNSVPENICTPTNLVDKCRKILEQPQPRILQDLNHLFFNQCFQGCSAERTFQVLLGYDIQDPR